ncbi:hypothetical protein, partial [Escherichia coli]|uniref:hypothetical protein n=1 Tax=Escherichia coli TaxID=562 RepID=UPI002024B8DC
MVDIVEADKTDIYFIQESVYGKIGLPAFGNTIGPSAQQVVKKVFAVVKERDKTHAKQRLLLEYNGNKLWMNAIDGSEAILPTEFSKRYELSLFNTTCLLYPSEAADDKEIGDLCGSQMSQKKKKKKKK